MNMVIQGTMMKKLTETVGRKFARFLTIPEGFPFSHRILFIKNNGFLKKKGA